MEREMTDLEKEISAEIAKVLLRLVPPGSRAVAGSEPYRYTTPAHVRLVCAGAVDWLAYVCCLEPGHKGKCYSVHKGVYFTSEQRLPNQPPEDKDQPGVLRGTVKWFNDAKGYGFVQLADADKKAYTFGGKDLYTTDVFVHHTAIETDGFRTLNEGQPVWVKLNPAGAKGLTAAKCWTEQPKKA